MTYLLFRKDQNDFFKKQVDDFKEEIKVWNIVNVFVPCLIILIPAILYSFLPANRVSFQNLLLNGSFSLLGINILFSMGTFLINSLRSKDLKIERQIREIRLRLLIYLCILLILGTVLYLLQIVFEINTTARILTVVFGIIIIIYFSLGIGRRIYMIKEELVGISYNEEINEDVKNLSDLTDGID